MKIDGAYSVAPRQSAQRKRGVSGGSRFSDALEPEGADGAAATVSTSPAAGVGSLLSIQEVPSASDGRSRGLARARDLIDGLEDIRRGLLMGTIPVSRLQHIARTMRDQKEATGDPTLAGLLADIELRAAVELAKLGIYI